jgi:hypothetical protein
MPRPLREPVSAASIESDTGRIARHDGSVATARQERNACVHCVGSMVDVAIDDRLLRHEGLERRPHEFDVAALDPAQDLVP